MTEQDHRARVWDIVERIGVCMLTTHSANGLRAREPQGHGEDVMLWSGHAERQLHPVPPRDP
jgi:hypothetical protein